MKFFAAVLLATLCVAVYSEELPSQRGIIKDSIVNVANKLTNTLSSALQAAKGKMSEFVNVVGEQKASVLSKISELKEQLKAEAKQALAGAVDSAKQAAAQQLVAQVDKVIGKLDGLKDKIDQLK